METFAVEINREGGAVAAAAVGPGDVRAASRARARSGKLSAYLELTKPRITIFIVLTVAAGYCLAPAAAAAASFDYARLFHTLASVALLSSGVAALNQYIERELDARMRRTAARPLPAGRLAPAHALWFGVSLCAAAEVYLAWRVNALTAWLGLAVIVGYVLLYTPLKTRTSLSTVVGAFPGAMPPLIGWTAATNSLGAEGWALFAILFFWQFPHFLAIAWMYREDYGKAGILMLPVVEPDGRTTAQQIIVHALLLLPVSLLPTFLGMAGRVYLAGALALGALLVAASFGAALTRSRQQARRLLLASVLYLPLLFCLMVLDQ